MKPLYDNSTKDKELSYYIETSLDKLGFRKNTLGTKYLKDFILFIFKEDVYEIFIDKLSVKFIKFMKIEHISSKNFITRIDYSIKNADIQKFKNNFYSVFKVEYDIYYLTIKNIVILFINALERM